MSRLAPCRVKHFTAWALIVLYRCLIEVSSVGALLRVVLLKRNPLEFLLEISHNILGARDLSLAPKMQ